VINGATRGRGWSPAAARAELRRVAATAGVRRRFAPHQLRHAHAVEMAHEGVPLSVIQRQLGHSNLGITSIYLQGIDNAEIKRSKSVMTASRSGDRTDDASAPQTHATAAFPNQAAVADASKREFRARVESGLRIA
jgi:integrase-like protein